jgi:hypothetical protein
MPVHEALPIVHTGEASAVSIPTPTRAQFIAQRMRSPRGLAVGGIALAALGLGLGWDWLAAVGVLPILLSFLPCAAMCALGLCMAKGREASPGPPPARHAPADEIDRTAQSPGAAPMDVNGRRGGCCPHA